MRSVMPSITGVAWSRLEADEPMIYPVADEQDMGERVMFSQHFPMPGDKARLVPAQVSSANELPDAQYPMALMTGRQLEHWHTGSMTRRATVLDAIEPEAVVTVHAADLRAIGAQPGDTIRLHTRRGSIHATARIDASLQPGQLFMAFCYTEAAANLLTSPVLEPHAKMAGLKVCPVRIDRPD
jgi:formate dehydrogenase major subunit